MGIIDNWLASKPSTKMKNAAIGQSLEAIKECFECPICRCTMEKSQQTSCGHVFCTDCLKKILSNSHSTKPTACPLCKKTILTRGFIERNDIDDMSTFATKLNDVFQKELKQFMAEKGRTKMPSIIKEKRLPEKVPCKKMSLSLSLKRNRKSDQKTSVGKDKPIVIDLEDEDTKSPRRTPGRVPSQFKSLQHQKQQKQNSPSPGEAVDTDERMLKKSEILTISAPGRNDLRIVVRNEALNEAKNQKEEKIKMLMNQEYVITTASVVPEPMDLSMSRKRSGSSSPKYVFKEAIKYVKPLDLSVKKEQKRKLESTDDAENNKRRRFGEIPQKQTVQTNKQLASPAPSKKKTTQELLDAAVEMVDLDTDDGKNVTSSDELIRSIPDASLQNKATQKNIASSFEEPVNNITSPRTSSDELFRSIPEEEMSKLYYQTKEVTSHSTQKKTTPSFKEPISKTSQSSKKHNKEIRPLVVKDAFETSTGFDDFNLPTDSDAMFANMSESIFVSKTTTATNSKPSQQNQEGNSGESNNEKENSANTKAIALDNSASKKKVYSGDCFGFDEDDDDDWLGKIGQPVSSSVSIVDVGGQPHPPPAPIDSTDSRTAIDSSKIASHISQDLEQRYVFCPSRLNKSQTAKLQSLCKMSNGTITREFTSEVTHLIIPLANGRVPQTMKYLLAIAGRKWVVMFDWVEKCLDQMKIVPEVKYETSNYHQSDPGVKRSRLSKTNLFDGFYFHFSSSSNFKNKFGFTSEEIHMLMSTLGAEVISSLETFNGALIVIGAQDENDTEHYNWLNTKHWITVTFDYVIDCILEYKLQPVQKKHLCLEVPEKLIRSLRLPKSIRLLL